MNARSPIGIDLGSHSLKAAQLERDGTLFAFADIPRREPGTPIGEADFVRLRGVLYRLGFCGTRVVLSAPKELIQRLTIDLPPLDSGAPIDEIARSELCRQRGLTPGSFEYCWHETPQPPRHASGARAVTEMCAHEHANTILDLAESQGFSPIGLHSVATVCATLTSRLDTQRTVAAVDLGWADATFVTARAGQIRFIRSVTGAGLAAMTGSEAWLADALGDTIRDSMRSGDASLLTGPEFALLAKRYRATVTAEVASSFDYLEGCNQQDLPSSIMMIGGGSAFPGLPDEIAARIDIEIHRPESAAIAGGSMASALASLHDGSGLRFSPSAETGPIVPAFPKEAAA